MDKRVYGVIGIKSVMANWNADFSGMPKTISSGEIFGSDKALKYPIKRYFMEKGEKVLYTKTMKFSDDNILGIKSLKERYEELFDTADLKAVKDQKEILRNLFSATDVRNFGATFAEGGSNVSITGAVQIGQGFNKYEDSYVETQQILSPFRNSKDKIVKTGDGDSKEEKERNQASLGTKTVSNEAHYVYPFVINPLAYDEFKNMGVTAGYTEEDYKKLKDAMLVSATAYSTNAKMGCDNELAVFIETEKDLYLPDLSQHVIFEKNDKNTYKIKFSELLNSMRDKILKVEIYYNDADTKVEHDIKAAKEYNLFTKEEL